MLLMKRQHGILPDKNPVGKRLTSTISPPTVAPDAIATTRAQSLSSASAHISSQGGRAAWRFCLYNSQGQGLTGSRLWEVVKDDYEHGWTQFVHDQLAQMRRVDSKDRPSANALVAHHYNG
jgi:hypothetical protein